MGIFDDFWANVEKQITELRSAKSADDVIRICPAQQGASGEGFFAGSGGDDSVEDALRSAGWVHVRRDAGYYWCMRAGNGDLITYVEGDLYRGNQML